MAALYRNVDYTKLWTISDEVRRWIYIYKLCFLVNLRSSLKKKTTTVTRENLSEQDIRDIAQSTGTAVPIPLSSSSSPYQDQISSSSTTIQQRLSRANDGLRSFDSAASISQINQVVSAISKLWESQVQAGINNPEVHQHPRYNFHVAGLRKLVEKSTTKRRRENFEDRTAGMFENHDTDKKASCCLLFLHV